MRAQPGRTLTTKRSPASHNQPANQPEQPHQPAIPLTLSLSKDQPKGETAIGTVQSHQRSSQHFLYRARVNLAFGKIGPASIAIRRSASHAVTAAALHWDWGFRTLTKRRLTISLRSVVRENGLPAGHLVTFSEVYYYSPERLESFDCPDALRILARLHRRVRHLADDLNHAIAEHPNPPTLEQIIAQAAAQPPPPPPSPTISTLGELYDISSQDLDAQYRDHPLDCPDCTRLRRDPTMRGSIIFKVSRPPCVADQWPRRFTRPSQPLPS